MVWTFDCSMDGEAPLAEEEVVPTRPYWLIPQVVVTGVFA